MKTENILEHNMLLSTGILMSLILSYEKMNKKSENSYFQWNLRTKYQNSNHEIIKTLKRGKDTKTRILDSL